MAIKVSSVKPNPKSVAPLTTPAQHVQATPLPQQFATGKPGVLPNKVETKPLDRPVPFLDEKK